MIEQLQQFIAQHQLFEPSDKLLLTVSGGKDSMVMLHLFQQLPYQISVAHCNFGLRGEESIQEEAFVKDYCEQFQIPFYVKRFDMPQYMKEHKVSVQEAARNLRYEWFNQVAKEQNLDKILTAHHKTDHLETIILHLVRGTGIKGLHGILVSQNKLIRPLLFTTSADILKYAEKNHLMYMEDSSNEKLVYRRNLVRKKILPILFEMNPEVENTFYKFSEYILSYESIINQYIQQEIEKIEMIQSDGVWTMKIDGLKEHRYANLVLFELLKKFEFTHATVEEILLSNIEMTGNIYYSNTHELLLNRNQLIVRKKEEKANRAVFIHAELKKFSYNGKKYVIESHQSIDNQLLKQPGLLFFDAKKLQFPLTIRAFKQGDKFQPIGLKGQKLLSDWFIDKKLNRFEKQSIGVIEDSKNVIIGLLGFTISEKVKIGNSTKDIICIKLQQQI